MVNLKPGMRLKSAMSDVQVMVVKGNPAQAVNLCCGGVAMLDVDEDLDRDSAAANIGGETLMGKRYTSPDQSVELLCTKGGPGALSIDGDDMIFREARELPSSD